jgi:MipA family protein
MKWKWGSRHDFHSVHPAHSEDSRPSMMASHQAYSTLARSGSARTYGSSAGALNGLRDVDFTIETGLFAEFYPVDWLRLRGAVRYGFIGHEGIVGDLGADAIWQPAPAWTFAAGPRVSYGDDGFTSAYFDVSPAESLASGLQANDADGGFTSFGLAASTSYRFDNGVAITGFAAYSRLVGDAADAPLVRQRGSEDQFRIGTSLTYSFPIGW